MGRIKQFNRNDVLQKALPLFWEKGFANTGMQEIEKATGVNKSGLYSEFKDKNEIFLESLKYYIEMQSQGMCLLEKPLGWKNIKTLLNRVIAVHDPKNPQGCFMINSFRELSGLPKQAHDIIGKNREALKEQAILNLKAEGVSNPEVLADLILTFFSGLAIEQNLSSNQKDLERKVARFLKTIQEK
jgi:TetR/AcrR family transcriptional regulator, copper-responsive repressor